MLNRLLALSSDEGDHILSYLPSKAATETKDHILSYLPSKGDTEQYRRSDEHIRSSPHRQKMQLKFITTSRKTELDDETVIKEAKLPIADRRSSKCLQIFNSMLLHFHLE